MNKFGINKKFTITKSFEFNTFIAQKKHLRIKSFTSISFHCLLLLNMLVIVDMGIFLHLCSA